MAEQAPIAVFVKLSYWESYRAAVVLTARVFRKILFIFGSIGALWILLLVISLVRPSPEREWYQTIQSGRQLMWVIGLPILFVFVLPLFSAAKVVADERVKKGINYALSDHGVHVESSVATADLQWAAIRQALETRSAFLLFTGPNIAHTLPKRCFTDTVELATMRELLRVHVPKAKLRKV